VEDGVELRGSDAVNHNYTVPANKKEDDDGHGMG